MPSHHLNLSFLDFAASGFATLNLNTVATGLVDSDLCVIDWIRGPFFGLSRTRLPWVCTQYIIKAPANKNYWSPPEDNPHKHRLPDKPKYIHNNSKSDVTSALSFRKLVLCPITVHEHPIYGSHG